MVLQGWEWWDNSVDGWRARRTRGLAGVHNLEGCCTPTTSPSAPNKPHPWFGLNPHPCPRETERAGEPDPSSRVSTSAPPPLQPLPGGGSQTLWAQKMLPAPQNWGIFSVFPFKKGSSTHTAPALAPPQRYSHDANTQMLLFWPSFSFDPSPSLQKTLNRVEEIKKSN